MRSADARLEAARRVLVERGFAEGEVRAEGPQGEIASVRIAPEGWERLLGEEGREVAARIRALGFGFVALDLG